GERSIGMSHHQRIMYIEDKSKGIYGPARIGRVTYSKTGQTITYQGKQFKSLVGTGFKANYYEAESGDENWISGCHKDGGDACAPTMVDVDEDGREEFCTVIRMKREMKDVAKFKCKGKYNK